MLSPSRSWLACGVAALAFMSLAGCSDQTYVYPAEEDTTPSALVVAPVPPPAQSEEVKVGLSNPRTQLWRPGHWTYESQRFYWIPGELLTRPSPTAVWSPDRWEHRMYGWVFIHGYWE